MRKCACRCGADGEEDNINECVCEREREREREGETREKEKKNENIGPVVTFMCSHFPISRGRIQRGTNGGDSRYRTCPPADI